MMINSKQPKFKLTNFPKKLLLISLIFALMLTSVSYVLMAQGAEPNIVSVSNQTMLRNAVNSAAASREPVVIIFENDITLTGTALTIPRNADVTLESNSTLASENGVEFFKLIGASGVNTILVDNGGILKINGIVVTHSSGNGHGVEVNFNGVLELKKGKISGNAISGYGGGVSNGGFFNMTGGTISDNTATSSGGGVYNSEGTFIMTGGVISNNNATYYGGGVYSTGIFSVRGGKIYNNTLTYASPNYGGGGVYNTGNFVFESGVISNNECSSLGGGVYSSGTFTMSGGVISNNKGSYGGGVYSTGSSLKLSDGVISGNNATVNGGGVCSSGDSFELVACEIYDNTAVNGGGIWRSGAFNMINTVVYDNHVSGNGGGVYKSGSGSTFSMYGGVISNNTATGNGGGVYLYGNFEMYDGSVISDNSAPRGGGIYLTSNGFVHLYSGKISGNYANIGGGVWVTDTYGIALNRLLINATVEFSDNRANRGYYRLPADDGVYNDTINCVVWSDPFDQGYNNYDISYVRGSALTEFTVTVTDTYPQTPKWLTYISNGTIRANVTIDAGIPPAGMVFDKWVAISGDVEFDNATNPRTTFKMPSHPVEIKATWKPIDTVSYVVHYYEVGTNVSLVADKPVNNQTMNDTVTEDAVVVDGYSVDAASKSLVLGAIDNVITFYYTPNTDIEYTVYYYLQDTNINIAGNKHVANLPMATCVTEFAVPVAGYTALFPTNDTAVLNATNNVFVFYYALAQFYSIVYELNGGVNPPANPFSYTPASLPVVIEDPTRVNCTFSSWNVQYANGTNITALHSYVIPIGTTGDIQLIACWQECVHNYTWVIVDPTCTEQGYTTFTCLICNDQYVDNYVPAFGHNYFGIVVIPASCTSEGLSVFVCLRCTDNYFENIAKTEHVFGAVDEVVAPTCEDEGYTVYKCLYCNATTTRDFVAPLGHDYFRFVVVSPSCSSEGLMASVCLRCTNYGVEPIAKLDHTYVSVITEPTCVEQGYTTFICSVCGYSYTGDVVDALGHDWQVTQIVSSTCDAAGYSVYECLRCGESMQDDFVAPLGHDYFSLVVVQPSFSSEGLMLHLCLRCTYNYFEPIAKLGDPAITDVEYVVHYYEVGTNVSVAPSVTVIGQIMNDTVTEDAVVIPGYIVDVGTKSLVLAASGNEIVFYYTPRTDVPYVVHYYLVGTNVSLVADKTVVGQTMGATVTEDAVVVPGYTVDKSPKNLTLVAVGGEIVFYYTPYDDISYVAHYYVIGTSNSVAPDKIVTDQPMNTIVTENAVVVTGYTVDESHKSLLLAASGNEIIFYYIS
jgi:hypothetical protein